MSRFHARKCAYLFSAASLLSGLLFSAPASADVVVLTSNNSTATFNTGANPSPPGPSLTTGQTSWFVDGVSHLKRQWFWYRVGDVSGESAIDTLFQTAIDTSVPNQLGVQYGNAPTADASTFFVTLTATLSGGSPGSFTSDLEETIEIDNFTGSPMAVRFFQYADFDLSGTPIDQTVNLAAGALTASATQTDGDTSIGETVTAITAPGAVVTRVEANNFPNTLNSLNDGSPTTLSNVSTIGTPGDLTWAFEWAFTLNDGESFTLQKDKLITSVPEPTSMGMLSLFGLAALRRRRQA